MFRDNTQTKSSLKMITDSPKRCWPREETQILVTLEKKLTSLSRKCKSELWGIASHHKDSSKSRKQNCKFMQRLRLEPSILLVRKKNNSTTMENSRVTPGKNISYRTTMGSSNSISRYPGELKAEPQWDAWQQHHSVAEWVSTPWPIHTVGIHTRGGRRRILLG